MSLDLSSLDTVAASDKGARIELRNPISNEPLGAFVHIYGKHSKAFQGRIRDLQNERIRQASVAAKIGQTPKAKTAEELEAEKLSLLVALTYKFENVTVDKKELEYSEDNAAMLYTRFPWVREQIDVAADDLANFMTA